MSGIIILSHYKVDFAHSHAFISCFEDAAGGASFA